MTDNSGGSAKNLVILGGAGFGREIAWMVGQANEVRPEKWNVIGFWGRDEDAGQTTPEGWSTLAERDVKEYLPDLWAVAAVGDPRVRERAVKQAQELGCHFATLLGPDVQVAEEYSRIGQGSIIATGSVVSVNVTIGEHVNVSGGCIIGHDAVIEDFATLSPGCLVMGGTRIGKGAFLGVGAVTTEHRDIGDGAVIGAGGVVVKDIPPGVTALGVPAKPLG